MPAQIDTPCTDLADALHTVAVNSSYGASRALSKWFKKGVRLTTDGFQSVPIGEAASAAGDPEEAVVAVHMTLEGDISGDLLLIFPEKTALALVDIMIGAPEGTSSSIGELEASCLQETGNIVGSSFTNCVASWLKLQCIPASPTVVHDLACAVVEPLLVAQAEIGDEALMTKTEFELDGQQLDWAFLLLPSTSALDVMRKQCQSDHIRQHALHTIAINGAFNASRAMSKWLHKGVRLSTEGFEKIPLRQVCPPDRAEDLVVALHLELGSQLHGHTLMLLSEDTALKLVDILTQQELGTAKGIDEMARSCLEETGNIISSAFVNSWAKWLEIHSEPQPPQLHVDMLEAILATVVVDQAAVSDEVFMAKTSFSVDGRWLDWAYYLFPSPASLRLIESSLG